MAKTVLALYDQMDQAQGAVRSLADEGFAWDDISLIVRDAEEEYAEYEAEATAVDDAMDGVAVGTLLGGLTGLVVGLFALVIPGIGPVIAAGPLAAALAGTGAGAVLGGLVGALADLGIDEETAGYYAEGVQRGGVLVAVSTTDARADEAAAILETYRPVDLQARAAEWEEAAK